MEIEALPIAIGEGEEWNRETFDRSLTYAAIGAAKYPAWLQTLVNKHRLHPVVSSMLIHQPLNWEVLLRQWPHISDKDPQRLVYTPTAEYGEKDRVLVTSIGKYLAKHWPHVADHIKRDALALYTPDRLYFVHTIPEFILAVDNGPRSCMQTGSEYCRHEFDSGMAEEARNWAMDKTANEPDWQLHPYACYAPEHGWLMALRETPAGRIDGRALCLVHEGEKYFVRSYARPSNPGAPSETDQALHAWLLAGGYSHEKVWPDRAKLHMPYIGSRRRAPYIDGRTDEGTPRVSHCHDDIWEMDSDGDYECTETDGTLGELEDEDEDSSYRFCDGCDTDRDENTFSAVGRDGDESVCNHCISNNYTLVHAQPLGRYDNQRGYSEYYVRDGDAVWVKDQAYDCDNLPNDIVMLSDGDYADFENTVSIGGEYYLEDDDSVVHLSGGECPVTGDSYALYGNTWTCAATDLVYPDTVEFTEVDGEIYHPDQAPEVKDLTEKTL